MDMNDLNGPDDHLMFWADLSTAIAYYTITSQLLLFVYNPKVVKIFYAANDPKDSKKRHIFRLLFAVAVLFALFISMCGTGHLMNVFVALYPGSPAVKTGQIVIMLLMAVVSFATAIVGFKLFPAIADTIKGLELSSEGKIQTAESYLIEVVELIKESILVLSQDLVVVKCNDVSKVLFGGPIVGTEICRYIHDADLALFNDTVLRVIDSYNFGPSTIELRIRFQAPSLSPKSTRHSKASATRNRNLHKVYCADEPPPTVSELDDLKSAATSARLVKAEEDYIWIEVTMCKGKQIKPDGGFEYDLKMVCRDIDDRKKRALYQSLMEGTEERGRINESKLRYLSCIAHDLKTPLQSFTYSLDLLNHTDLHPEQREYVQHANVAVDLMKLTISQTMDISKALTGAKLMPRRTTVYLSSVLNRVKIIINGYGKSVPVSFEVAADVCDEIITDEEWLWQMLLNLLTNACKYTDRGSIHVRVSVSQDRTAQSNDFTKSTYSFSHKIPPLKIVNDASCMLLCEVIDTGVGIDPNKIGHIFDAFAQVQEGQVTGTGLGLFGVRTRAEGLKGNCGARHNIESSTGTGTVLWFAIPYTPDQESSSSVCAVPPTTTPRQFALSALRIISPANSELFTTAEESSNMISANTSANNSTSFSMPITPNSSFPVPSANQAATEALIRSLRLTAMVVEDTISVRKLMEKLLLKMGFASVVCYENGAKGLDAMMAAPVDIVFSDVQMPILTGPEMVARFRKWESIALANGSPQQSPGCTDSFLSTSSTLCHTFRTGRQLIVAVTANGAECGECGNKGFDEICPKPLSRTEIYRIINQYFQ